MTEQELLQNAKKLLKKYKFSEHALFDSRVSLGINVPDDLKAQWKKEYYEELVNDLNLYNKTSLHQLGDILGYGLVEENYQLLNLFYQKLSDEYPKIDPERKNWIINAERMLSDSIRKDIENEFRAPKHCCKTPEQRQCVIKFYNLAEKIYESVDFSNIELPKESIYYPLWNSDIERKQKCIDNLNFNIKVLRENRSFCNL